MYAYLVDDFKCIPILLNLEGLVNDDTSNNFPNAIFNSLLIYGGFVYVGNQ
jgi:hypothetical protein